MGITSINEPAGPGQTTQLLPNSINEPVPIEVPVIAALAPDECIVGQPDFTLFISGSGFIAASVINFAGHDEPTKLNGDGTLSTGVKPSLWANPVVVPVLIKNGPLVSEPVDFTFAAEGTPEADPDDLEDEIDQASEDGDFRPTHPSRKRRR